MNDTHNKFLEEQVEINREIAKAMIGATPEHWTKITLNITHLKTEDGYGELSYEFISPENHNELITPTNQVYESTTKLFNYYHENNKTLRAIICNAYLNTNKKWKLEIDYEYP